MVHKPLATCPFCALACDDLVVDRPLGGADDGDGIVRLAPNTCARADAGFTAAGALLHPLIKGRRVPMDTALAKATAILRDCRRPLYAGLDADIAGVKAVLALAEKSRGIVDHGGSHASFVNYRSIQVDGGFATTLSEAANRADCFIFFATNGVDAAPRLFERWIWREKKLFRDRKDPVHLVFIGQKPPPEAQVPPGLTGTIRHIPVDGGDLAEVAATLRMLWKRDMPSSGPSSGSPSGRISAREKDLRDVIATIRAGRYGVLSWYGANLSGANFPDGHDDARGDAHGDNRQGDDGHDDDARGDAHGDARGDNRQGDDARGDAHGDNRQGDLIVSMLSQWVQEINQSQRFAALPLGGNGNAVGAAQVSTWQNGFPLRVAYDDDGPCHDSWLFAHDRCGMRGEVDALVWISAFGMPARRSCPVSTPMIMMAATADPLCRKADVFIPIAMPGIDHEGTVVRCDSSVSVPLGQWRDGTRRSLTDIIGALEGMLAC